MVAGPSNGSFIHFVRAEEQGDQESDDTEPEEEVEGQEVQEPRIRDVEVRVNRQDWGPRSMRR